MNDAPTGKILKAEAGTDWERLKSLTPAAIHAALDDDSDAQPTDAAFWKTAKVVMPRTKTAVTIRLDADILDWMREQGPGYQTRINAILRAYMEGHRHIGGK